MILWCARISRLVCLGNSCCLNSQAPLSTLSCFLMNLKLGKAALNAAWSRHSNLREQRPKVRQSRSRSPPKVANQPRGPNHSPYYFDTTRVSAAKMEPFPYWISCRSPNKYLTVPSTRVATCCKICNLNWLELSEVSGRSHAWAFLFVWASTRVFVSPHQVAVPVPASLTQNQVVVEPTHLKNMSQNGFIFLNFRGEHKKYLSCHHLVKIWWFFKTLDI